MSARKGIVIAGSLSGLIALVLVFAVHAGCRPASAGATGKVPDTAKRVIVIGIDGMDPRLCERMMERGDLPNLNRLREAGGYSRLGTTIPPQSPVAWASFITGANPGVHGIFDFIHRDPSKQYAPYYAAAETIDSKEGWEVGEHRIPLTFFPFNHNPTHTLLKREGVPFWDYLDRAGIRSWTYDIPSNYPPTPSSCGHHCCLSGMGTPDLMGSYGTYQVYSTDVSRKIMEGGGIRQPLLFDGDAATAKLVGPQNTLLKNPVDTEIPFQVYRHPSEPLARIDVQGQSIVLKEGEWSDWCRVSFPLAMPSFLPDEHVPGVCRFYLQEVRPVFRLYVSPINIDPSDPGKQRISEPAKFVTEISDQLGLFYTTGFQEDHKALSNHVFTDEEYLAQATYVLGERMNLLKYALDNYTSGMLFFYFSSTDLQAHMFWWDSDGKHPTRAADEARKYSLVIEDLYRRMDTVVGDVLQRYGDRATIIVMSDHGFCNFRRQFNVNTWLRNNGYIAPANCDALLYSARGRLVDWSRTKAYGLGLNGLYLNLKGRERDGIVDPAERSALLDELRAKLLAVRDPVDGAPAILAVYRSDEVYSGPQADHAPDLIVGYARDYRCSWAATLGNITEETFGDNDSLWSTDHCMAAEELPGVVFANKPIVRVGPSLIDLAPTILEEFNLTPPATMTGGSLFQAPASVTAAAPQKE